VSTSRKGRYRRADIEEGLTICLGTAALTSSVDNVVLRLAYSSERGKKEGEAGELAPMSPSGRAFSLSLSFPSVNITLSSTILLEISSESRFGFFYSQHLIEQ
jgi:hypothetical protein